MATYDIPSRGLDKRKSGLNGLFGAGVYFGENSSKSDEYCGPLGSQGPFYVFLCRVAKGKPFITENWCIRFAWCRGDAVSALYDSDVDDSGWPWVDKGKVEIGI